MLLADKNIVVQLIEQGQVVIPTVPMIKGSTCRPFYWILLKEANLFSTAVIAAGVKPCIVLVLGILFKYTP